MTSDERFERIEHVTTNIAEQRRKDREEYRALWRDAERQMNEIRSNISQLAVEGRLRNEELRDLMEEQGREFRAADKVLAGHIESLGGRIESLVSAIGQFIARQ